MLSSNERFRGSRTLNNFTWPMFVPIARTSPSGENARAVTSECSVLSAAVSSFSSLRVRSGIEIMLVPVSRIE